MPERLNKVNAWASAVNGWGKILIAVIVFIVSIGTAWYQIQTNSSDNVRQDAQFHEVLETMKREFEVWGQRSDKRYNRAMEEAKELHKEDDKLEDKIEALQKQNLKQAEDIAYIKGYLDAKDK
jgi:peptidoglycan hydrolase CwlO-like protein